MTPEEFEREKNRLHNIMMDNITLGISPFFFYRPKPMPWYRRLWWAIKLKVKKELDKPLKF